MAVFIFLATATRTRIITSNFRTYLYRFLFNGNIAGYVSGRIVIIFFICGIVFAYGIYRFFICLHPAHVGFLHAAFPQLLRRFILLQSMWIYENQLRGALVLEHVLATKGMATLCLT